MENTMDSLGFSSLKKYMEIWEKAEPAMTLRTKINRIIDNQDLSLFFQKGEDIFGAPESSRVIFARLKNPDPDAPSGWADQAQFIAVNLSCLGEGNQITFGLKDLPKIKVLGQEDAIEKIVDRKK